MALDVILWITSIAQITSGAFGYTSVDGNDSEDYFKSDTRYPAIVPFVISPFPYQSMGILSPLDDFTYKEYINGATPVLNIYESIFPGIPPLIPNPITIPSMSEIPITIDNCGEQYANTVPYYSYSITPVLPYPVIASNIQDLTLLNGSCPTNTPIDSNSSRPYLERIGENQSDNADNIETSQNISCISFQNNSEMNATSNISITSSNPSSSNIITINPSVTNSAIPRDCFVLPSSTGILPLTVCPIQTYTKNNNSAVDVQSTSTNLLEPNLTNTNDCFILSSSRDIPTPLPYPVQTYPIETISNNTNVSTEILTDNGTIGTVNNNTISNASNTTTTEPLSNTSNLFDSDNKMNNCNDLPSSSALNPIDLYPKTTSLVNDENNDSTICFSNATRTPQSDTINDTSDSSSKNLPLFNSYPSDRFILPKSPETVPVFPYPVTTLPIDKDNSVIRGTPYPTTSSPDSFYITNDCYILPSSIGATLGYPYPVTTFPINYANNSSESALPNKTTNCPLANSNYILCDHYISPSPSEKPPGFLYPVPTLNIGSYSIGSTTETPNTNNLPSLDSFYAISDRFISPSSQGETPGYPYPVRTFPIAYFNNGNSNTTISSSFAPDSNNLNKNQNDCPPSKSVPPPISFPMLTFSTGSVSNSGVLSSPNSASKLLDNSCDSYLPTFTYISPINPYPVISSPTSSLLSTPLQSSPIADYYSIIPCNNLSEPPSAQISSDFNQSSVVLEPTPVNSHSSLYYNCYDCPSSTNPISSYNELPSIASSSLIPASPSKDLPNKNIPVKSFDDANIPKNSIDLPYLTKVPFPFSSNTDYFNLPYSTTSTPVASSTLEIYPTKETPNSGSGNSIIANTPSLLPNNPFDNCKIKTATTYPVLTSNIIEVPINNSSFSASVLPVNPCPFKILPIVEVYIQNLSSNGSIVPVITYPVSLPSVLDVPVQNKNCDETLKPMISYPVTTNSATEVSIQNISSVVPVAPYSITNPAVVDIPVENLSCNTPIVPIITYPVTNPACVEVPIQNMNSNASNVPVFTYPLTIPSIVEVSVQNLNCNESLLPVIPYPVTLCSNSEILKQNINTVDSVAPYSIATSAVVNIPVQNLSSIIPISTYPVTASSIVELPIQNVNSSTFIVPVMTYPVSGPSIAEVPIQNLNCNEPLIPVIPQPVTSSSISEVSVRNNSSVVPVAPYPLSTPAIVNISVQNLGCNVPLVPITTHPVTTPSIVELPCQNIRNDAYIAPATIYPVTIPSIVEVPIQNINCNELLTPMIPSPVTTNSTIGIPLQNTNSVTPITPYPITTSTSVDVPVQNSSCNIPLNPIISTPVTTPSIVEIPIQNTNNNMSNSLVVPYPVTTPSIVELSINDLTYNNFIKSITPIPVTTTSIVEVYVNNRSCNNSVIPITSYPIMTSPIVEMIAQNNESVVPVTPYPFFISSNVEVPIFENNCSDCLEPVIPYPILSETVTEIPAQNENASMISCQTYYNHPNYNTNPKSDYFRKYSNTSISSHLFNMLNKTDTQPDVVENENPFTRELPLSIDDVKSIGRKATNGLAARFPKLFNTKNPATCGPAALIASNGNGLQTWSESPAAPTGIEVSSKNEMAGYLAISGQLPFVGTVGFEGEVSGVGAGVVTYFSSDDDPLQTSTFMNENTS